MYPKTGSFVAVYLRGGLVEQGVVESWGKEGAVLKQKHSYSLINNLDDIVLVKIFEDKKEEPISNVSVDTELEPREYHREPIDRALDLAELHKLRIQEERERARKSLTEFRPTANLGTTYDNYSILRDESLLRDSSEEDR